MTTRTLWIDPAFGASGDMMLGALAGLAADPDAALAPLDGLGIDNNHGTAWTLKIGTTIRGGITATCVSVEASISERARHWSEIDSMLADSSLPSKVMEGARRTFLRLGEVEAAQHGVSLDDVHFHEVGAVDAIVDIVGAWLLLEAVRAAHHGIDEIVVGPVGLGHGTVQAAHGELPLPAPATAALLEGVAVRALDYERETCTPTGAALLVTMGTRFASMPAGVLGPFSRGAGRRDPQTHPNVLSMAVIANEHPQSNSVMIETNLDDVTPEILASTIESLLAAGADDAWIVPIIMKKGRPAHEVRVLCASSTATTVREVLAQHTGTLGMRTFAIDKTELVRHTATVEVRGAFISMKVGPFGAKPEHDDLAALSVATGVAIRVLAIEAQTEFKTH